MRIFVLGTRGIPEIQGGVETHCENLYPILTKMGCEVTIIRRKPYINSQNRVSEYKNIQLVDLYAPHLKSFEAIVHSLLGIFFAWRNKPDILHIHAIGPALVAPLARLLGLKVVLTHHGSDYQRQKWGFFAKTILKLGERFGAKFANQIIVISNEIRKLLENKYQRFDTNLIFNGIIPPQKSENTDFLDFLNLKPQKYIISVGRFVQEKGFDYLIDAFSILKTEYKLVLVGDADHETVYSQQLKEKAQKNNVILTGFIRSEKLNQIYSNAKLFILPSFHEGLPIALLEAMSYNLDVLVSDIPANLEVNLEKNDYFETGNVENLSQNIERKLKNVKIRNFDNVIKEKYNWENIARQTLEVYQKILNK